MNNPHVLIGDPKKTPVRQTRWIVGTKNFPRWEIGRLRLHHSLGSDCVLSVLVVVVPVSAERICGHPEP